MATGDYFLNIHSPVKDLSALRHFTLCDEMKYKTIPQCHDLSLGL